MTSTTISHLPAWSHALRVRASSSWVPVTLAIVFLVSAWAFAVVMSTQLQPLPHDAPAFVVHTGSSSQLSSALFALGLNMACCLAFALVWKDCLGTRIHVPFFRGLLWLSTMVGASVAYHVITLALPDALNSSWGDGSFTVQALLLLKVFTLLGFLVWLRRSLEAMSWA